jgi:Uma2 family endonuclease
VVAALSDTSPITQRSSLHAPSGDILAAMSEPALHLPPPPPDDGRDQRVVMRGVTWAQYEAIQAIRGERRVPRLSYLNGSLELMSPGRNHERVAQTIAQLLVVWSLETDTALYAYGAWTLKSAETERGVEPDQCYTVGDGDAEKDVPDLAIEVAWTHEDLDKLAIDAGLGVREVWSLKASRLTVQVLRGGAYVAATRSEVLPAIDLALLARFADRVDQPKALREYRDALRAATT